MQVASPMPEVIGLMALTLPVTGPSREDCPALFEEPIMLGDEGIGRDTIATSGESLLTLRLGCD